jgi:hypothetical protein
MTTCTVDGRQFEIESGCKTWGQLLSFLERDDGPGRAVVTAVRFDGVDQPSFREAGDADLESVGSVEIGTIPECELIDSAVRAVLDSIAPLVAAARQTAEAFRIQDLPRAHRGLADFVETFRWLTDLTAALSQAEESGSAPAWEVRSAGVLDELRESLESLIAFESDQDWLSVADVLELEIATALPRWHSVLSCSHDGFVRPQVAVA